MATNLNDPNDKGRKKTDGSLLSERLRTDDSLLAIKSDAENLTADAFSEDRVNNDQELTQTRLQFDKIRNKKSGERSSIQEKESKNADSWLMDERHALDEILEKERKNTDSILADERGQKSVVEQKLFARERKETDSDLAFERTHTDHNIERSDKDLAREKADHGITKVSLTTRDEFLAIVSHDLRNPLGAISMASQFISTNSAFLNAGKEARTLIDLIDLIKRNAQSSLGLISDLLDLERMASGKLGLKIQPYNLINLINIINNACEDFLLAAASKKIELTFKQLFAPLFADCDRARITQVLSNLLGNAMKFTPSGGKISIEIVEKEFQISVSDTGQGISEHMWGAIFERYSQIKVADRRGLGLGLCISKAIIERHNGRIWVSSKTGEGSTFTFTLPKSVISDELH